MSEKRSVRGDARDPSERKGAGFGAGAGASLVKPEEEEKYWREQYVREPYYKQGSDFEHYSNAYRVGYMGRVKYDGRSYHDIEDELAADYAREESDLAWHEARPAARAAWDRVDRRAQDLKRN